jgi:phosphatidate cytidylyltransferase
MGLSAMSRERTIPMLLQRVLVTAVLLPIGLAVIYFGGLVYFALIALILGLAAWEYVQLFRAGGFQPAGALVVGGVLLITGGRAINGFESAPWILSLIILVTMAFHALAYERGRDQAATDFAVTLGGVLYLGWLGAYLISLRGLTDGLWWVLLALPIVWLADSGAYFVGRWRGRRKLSPRLSPKKTWEGYLAGILTGVLGGALLSFLWGTWVSPQIGMTPWHGVVLGVVLSLVTTMGDLGESMIKRQVGIKDSSNLIPGHGGALDRIDSWLWAGVISYYVILFLY